MSKVVAAFAQLGDLQERSDRQQALATKAVEVDKSHSCIVAWFIPFGVHDIGTHGCLCTCLGTQAMVYNWCDQHYVQRLHFGRISESILPVLHAEGAFIDYCAVGQVL